jgi:hypothetical protein
VVSSSVYLPEEIKNVLKILKPNKSPGEDGIISEFYITHWEQIKDEFFLLVNDTFEKKELTPLFHPLRVIYLVSKFLKHF